MNTAYKLYRVMIRERDETFTTLSDSHGPLLFHSEEHARAFLSSRFGNVDPAVFEIVVN